MTIYVDWDQRIIHIPKADTQVVQLLPTEIRQLDLDLFRLTLKDLEDDEQGMPFLDTHSHNLPVTVGGVTLARVVEIINGYTITFEDGQYAVNLVGANSNVADVTNVNQVSIRSANSAGLTFSQQINDQSFQDAAIWVDTVDGLPGTGFPRGTPTDPVDNIQDAITIAVTRNLRRLRVRGTIVFTEPVEGYHIEAQSSQASASINLNGVSVDGCHFRNVVLSGTGSGTIDCVSCRLGSVAGVLGRFYTCGVEGVTIPSGAGDTEFINCFSEIPGSARPTIDASLGAGDDLMLRGWMGGVRLINVDVATQDVSIDLVSGTVELDSSCTAGTIVVRGVGVLIDNSAGSTVISEGLISKGTAAAAVWDELLAGHTTPGSTAQMLNLIQALLGLAQ